MSFRRDFVSLFFSTLRSERERADIEQLALVATPRGDKRPSGSYLGHIDRDRRPSGHSIAGRFHRSRFVAQARCVEVSDRCAYTAVEVSSNPAVSIFLFTIAVM